MVRADVAGMLASGQLSSTDLFWHENTWHPLEDIMGDSDLLDEEKERQLALKAADAAGQDLKELEDCIGELAPLHQVPEAIPVAEAVDESKPKSKGRRGFPFGRKKKKEAEAVEESGEAAVAEVEAKPRNKKVYIATQALMGVLAVGLGFKFGIGPLISSVRKKPMRVVVQNHEDIDYVAKLGWRRLTQELYKESICGFEVFVGMPEKQTLRVAPKEGDGESFKLKIPLRPGGLLMVNLKQKGKYGVFDLAAVRGKKAGAELGRLASEISKNVAPKSATGAANSAHKIAVASFTGTVDDLLFYGDDYRFPVIAMYGVAPEEDKKAKDKPFLAYPPIRQVAFSGGNATYDHRAPKVIKCSLRFPGNVKVIRLSKATSVKLDPKRLPNIEMANDSKKVSLSMRIPQNGFKVNKRAFNGEWDYRASRPLGGKKPVWTWSWTYRGNSYVGGKHFRATVTVRPGGKETRKVDEIKQPR